MRSTSPTLSSLEKVLFSPKGCYETTELDDIPTWAQCQARLKRLCQLKEGSGSATAQDSEPRNNGLITTGTNSRATNAQLANMFSLVWDDLTTLRVDCIVNAANGSFTCGGGINGTIHRKAGAKEMQLACQQALKIKARRQPANPKQEQGLKSATNVSPANPNEATCNTSAAADYLKIAEPAQDDDWDDVHVPLIGDGIVTPGFNLPCRYVIHMVSPSLVTQDMLGQCYTQALDMAFDDDIQASSIAFCNLGCGSHLIPVDQGADIALEACMEWAKRRLLKNSKGSSSARPFRIIFCCLDESDLKAYRDKMMAKLRAE